MTKLKSLALALCLFVPAAGVTAQAVATPKTKDPVSGHWVEDGTAFLRLKFDGKRAVSGQIVLGRRDNLVDIKTGTFDWDTSVLKIEGDTKHPDTGANVHFVVEGKIVRDTIRVVGKFGNESGSKTLVRKPAASP